MKQLLHGIFIGLFAGAVIVFIWQTVEQRSVGTFNDEPAIEKRDKEAVTAAEKAGTVAAQEETKLLDDETDDQVLDNADPAVQAIVKKAIQDHEWEHHTDGD